MSKFVIFEHTDRSGALDFGVEQGRLYEGQASVNAASRRPVRYPTRFERATQPQERLTDGKWCVALDPKMEAKLNAVHGLIIEDDDGSEVDWWGTN